MVCLLMFGYETCHSEILWLCRQQSGNASAASFVSIMQKKLNSLQPLTQWKNYCSVEGSLSKKSEHQMKLTSRLNSL
ncbi:hypothetical protein MUK42_16395, partial [Musa troglodytarum]